MRLSTLILAMALTLCADNIDAAFAKGGRTDRVRSRITMTAESFDGRARLEVRRANVSDAKLRLSVERATPGLDLRIAVENADGVLTEVASLTESRPGQYTWRVRTKKGDALPFGQSDLSGLSGRRVEVRTAAGATAFAAKLPVIAVAAAPVTTRRSLRTNLAVDRAVASSIDAPGLRAHTEVGRKRNGRQTFAVKVQGAVSGQTLEVWIEDRLTHQMKLLSLIQIGAAPSPGAAKQGSSDSGSGSDDDADDDGVSDDHEDEGQADFDTDDGDDLPDDADDVEDLAGLDVEIRTTGGDVVAQGEVGAVGDSPRADDDDDDGAEDGTESDDD